MNLRGALMPLLAVALLWVAGASAAPSVALHYGATPPLDELKAFDVVVVEPDHGADPVAYGRGGYSALYAYVAVGEVQPSRAWFAALPANWLRAENQAWGSRVIDLSQPGYAGFLAEHVVAPLWEKGYRGFFLDTLDSYRRIPGFDEAAQQAGLVRVVDTLHQRFPGIQLILNRGFEVLPAVRDKVRMVAAESLYQGWDAARQRYVEVPAADRDWLVAQLRRAQDELAIPVLAIDYVSPVDRALTRRTAQRIKQLGFTPYVADGALETLGIGRVEVMPRRVLALYNKEESPLLDLQDLERFVAMPLNHLGYVLEYREVGELTPGELLNDRYAGIVTAFGGYVPNSVRYGEWLLRQIQAGMRLAVLRSFGFGMQGPLARGFGVQVAERPRGELTIAHREVPLGFEVALASLVPDRRRLDPLRLIEGQGRSRLRLTDAPGEAYDAVAETAWGAYALDPYAFVAVPGIGQSRWVIDPFLFLQRALALPPMPVPDATTENGRRLFFAHIDGDGFASRAEFPGAPLAAEILLKEVLEKYRLPHTVSVIEGEVSPQGLYPALAESMEGIARRMFALPHVEIASHTYSHPFKWSKAEAATQDIAGEPDYHLAIPGYEMDPQREIAGSADYIRTRLAPAGKPVKVMLWSGDAAPAESSLRLAREAGLLNMNGGITTITRGNASLTAVGGVGIRKGNEFQTYAPVMNENLYTNLWRGPFYGYRAVVETFEMTGLPRRLTAVNIYYHTYSASKPAALKALQRAYDWALAQPLHPVFASEYIAKAQDFDRFVIARDGEVWLARGAGALRTLRAPAAAGYPRAVQGLAGWVAAPEGDRYLHLSGASARFELAPQPFSPTAPYLVAANARLSDWAAGEHGVRFRLDGHVPLDISLARMAHCRLRADDRPVSGTVAADGTTRYRLPHAAATFEARCD